MMLKHEAKTKDFAKVVPFDDTGEIQVVPIDTVIDDGGHDLEADDPYKNHAQGFGARSEYRPSSKPLRVDSNAIVVKVTRTETPVEAADHAGGSQISWLNPEKTERNRVR